MGSQEIFAAEQAAIAAYQNRGRGRTNALGIRVPERYNAYRTPGLDATKMLSDPKSMLRSPKDGATYIWRKPDDTYTKAMVGRGTLRPVTIEEIDPTCPHANVDNVRLITSRGPIQVVRTPGGLGLYEAPSSMAMSEADRALLPGEHWDAKYLEDLSELPQKFEQEVEKFTPGSETGRLEPYDSKIPENRRMEPVL